MALFSYRPWAGTEKTIKYLQPEHSLYYTRWGYSALLGITLAAGLAANITYLMGYITCPRAMLQVPHIAIVGLCIRDLLVCLIVFPAALAWCGVAVFFDFFLNAVYPFLLFTLALILYTRKVPPPRAPSREPSLRIASSRMSARSGYTQRTHQSQPHSQQLQRVPGRAPSVASQRPASQNQNQTGDFRRGFSKSLNGSVSGSEYGGSQVGRMKQQQFLSPMRGIEEEYTNGRGQRSVSPVGSDLWESASLDYPGRDDLPGEFDPIDEYDDEPRLREWMRLFVPLSFLLAFGFGIPAAINIETETRPNCFVKVDPFREADSRFIIRDPGYNLMLCSVIVTYLAPVAILLMLSLLLCTTRWTKDGKLNRFYKMCIALSLFFVAVKSPIDIIQFQNLLEVSYGNRIVNTLSSEMEYEILLVWSSLLPVIANPIIYLTCVSDYRVNIAEAWKSLRNRKISEEEYFPETKETQESDVL